MAQITKDLVAVQRARHARGEHMNLTINEEEQLLQAWEQHHLTHTIKQIRNLINTNHACMLIAIEHQLVSKTGDWYYRPNEALSIELAEAIYKEMLHAVKPEEEPSLTAQWGI